MISAETIRAAKDVQKMFGSNYHAATLLLPKETRYAVYIFYAFVRRADELVDNPQSGISPEESLETFTREWQEAYESGKSHNALFLAWREIMLYYQIPFELTIDFLKAMKQDFSKSSYKTYAELQEYMYGSAEVIGIILTKLFGCTNVKALPHARALGEAMQLTNFIRDIYEDRMQRNRIYLPSEDLEQFGILDKETLINEPDAPSVKALLAFECARAHRMYEYAREGIAMLPSHVRPAVRVAAALYEEILFELSRRGGGVQTTKIRFSSFEKIKIALMYGYIKK